MFLRLMNSSTASTGPLAFKLLLFLSIANFYLFHQVTSVSKFDPIAKSNQPSRANFDSSASLDEKSSEFINGPISNSISPSSHSAIAWTNSNVSKEETKVNSSESDLANVSFESPHESSEPLGQISSSTSSSAKLLRSKQMIQSNNNPSINRFKNKRDEIDNFGGAFGRGIGFFVGEPCMDTLQCNPILFNVYCNQSTGRCECTSDFPVNIYNRVCVKALRLGEACEFHESCRHLDSHAICNQFELKCRCQENFYPRISDNGIPECIQGRAIFSPNHWLPWVTLATSILALGALIFGCTLLRRLSKGTSNDPHEVSEESPSNVQRVTSLFDQSPMNSVHHHHYHLHHHQPSQSHVKQIFRQHQQPSHSHLNHHHQHNSQCDSTLLRQCNISSKFSSSSPSKEQPFSASLLPSRLGRRWSGSSIRSQSSLFSSFSFRSQSSLRNNFQNLASSSIHPLSFSVFGGPTSGKQSNNKEVGKLTNEFPLTRHPLMATNATSPNSTATVTTSTSTTSNNITTVTGTLGFKPYIHRQGPGTGTGESHSYSHRMAKPLVNLPYARDSIELERDVLI